jgi:undecaprenyl pyrophosphate synthase
MYTEMIRLGGKTMFRKLIKRNKTKINQNDDLDIHNLPEHIAIIFYGLHTFIVTFNSRHFTLFCPTTISVHDNCYMLFRKLIKRNKTKINQNDDLDIHNLPEHIAIIMDGNGRWAKKRKI